MKSKKKFVLAGLMLLATVLVLPLVGCDTGSGGGSVAQKPATNTPGGGTDGNGGNGGNGKEYTVTFKANGGTFADGKDTKTETVESGNAATKPTDPTNGDKVLAGWYEDRDLTKKFDFSTPVTADITLYAKWQTTSEDGDAYARFDSGTGTSQFGAGHDTVITFDTTLIHIVHHLAEYIDLVFDHVRQLAHYREVLEEECMLFGGSIHIVELQLEIVKLKFIAQYYIIDVLAGLELCHIE